MGWIETGAFGAEPLVAVAQVTGLAGAAVYIGGYFLVQSGRMCGNSILYPLSKIAAAALVLSSLVSAFNLASFVIQIAYMGISVIGIARQRSGASPVIAPDQGPPSPPRLHLVAANAVEVPTLARSASVRQVAANGVGAREPGV